MLFIHLLYYQRSFIILVILDSNVYDFNFKVTYTSQVLRLSIIQGVSLFGSRGNIDVFRMLFSPR